MSCLPWTLFSHRYTSFALELMKDMNIRYVAPPMPIHLMLDRSGGTVGIPEWAADTADTAHHRKTGSVDISSLAAMFEARPST
jgi:hypothetical protein